MWSMAQKVKRAFKYRFYPTDEQAAELSRTFGCVRKVYNLALEARSTAWRAEQRRIGYAETSALLTGWKKTDDLAFLAEVSCVPLQQTLRHLQGAFVGFWGKRAAYPRFKSRKGSRASAEYTRSGFSCREGQLTLAKMREPLAVVWSRPLPEGVAPTTVTVSRDAAGRWHVSILCDDAVDALPPSVDAGTGELRAVGIDVGITSLLTLSTGEKVTNPRFERADRARFAKAQRNLARKEKGSCNRERARAKVARVHARIADRRRDHLHKLTTRLVRENLAVRNMLGNHTLARAISDASWSELRSMLQYKADWYGRELIVVDRWYPSSKTCSACGHVASKMALDVREWTCDRCTALHDRDVNAAVNILAAGLAVNACGGGVRPQRDNSRPGQRPAKQEALTAK